MDRNGSDSFHCHIGVPLLFLLFHWSCRSLNLVCQLLKSFYLAVVLVFFLINGTLEMETIFFRCPLELPFFHS